ncbi:MULTISPECIES: hypothetical protein [Petrotoga]|uniref:Uncharacterized protein n=2 Tax=Petrotoga sibirica TaxID=156202 RepID=A0A4V3GQL2_9BACT|nr:MULTISPECIES: hypothetical protein [Petrotoga]POZ88948.1 hypothetical protein AA80_03495 [Petrotoga sibirica DSM 13575]POZ91185.1 hypothetical protein AD60_04315 [Petrotoga sp. SL27]TDX15533.1 hypothetical protein C8D74_10616 [Petrotoga sibirica]
MTIKGFRKLFVLIFCMTISLTIFSSTVYTPPKDLYQLETENYRFVFEKDLYYFYEEIADTAEELYTKYTYFYGSNPGKITVYILDDVDFTNSFAFTGTNVIRLYINPPEDFLALGGNVEDWSKFVFSHELNHIFYGSDVRDPFISWVPSKLIKNTINMVHQPSYLHEGISIYMESKEFGGRFEDDLFNMYLRSEILSNNFPRYYLGSGSSIDIWSPAGFNYMYGTILVKKIVNNYGEDTLRQIIRVLNTNVFSNLDEAFYWVTGDSWTSFLIDIKQEYLNDYDQLKEKGYKLSWLKIDNTYQNTGNLRTDGISLYGYLVMPDQPKGAYKDGELIKKGVSSFDVNSRGNFLYLVTTYNMGYYTNKLYYDCACPNGGRFLDERVKAFGFVGDEKIAYSKLDKGLTALYLYDLRTNETKKLIDYGKYVFNDIVGEEDIIYFSANYKNQTDIYSYDLSSEKIYQITDDEVEELGLFIDNDFIYYSANYQDGIYNIYRLNTTKKTVERLTNYLSGSFEPVVLNDKLYHLVYDHEGYHLSYLDLESAVKESFVLQSVVAQVNFESYEIYYPEDVEVKKYTFEKPYILPFPILAVDMDDNILYGAGAFFISEAMNYIGFIDAFTDGSKIYGDLSLIFDYYTTNSITLSLTEEDILTSFYISNSYLWYLRNTINTFLGGGSSFKNTSFDSYVLDSIFQISPYSVNNYNIYEMGIGITYDSISGIKANLDKPFVVFDTKIDPYIGYAGGSIYAGSKVEKVLSRPYLSFESGKYRFDGIKAGGDVKYDFGQEKFDYLAYIQFDLSIFYWLNVPLQINSDMFKPK